MSDENRESVDSLRLRWVVKDEPIKATIQVLDDALDPKSAQKPYENDSGELHAISKASVSTHPLKILSVTLPDLENIITYDECPEDHPDYTDECGIPFNEPICEVTASNGEFITIGDYINAVYPWLVSLRDRYFEDAPIPGYDFHPDTELWVKPLSLLGGIKLHHAEPHNMNGDSDTHVWAHTAEIADKIQNGWPKSDAKRFLTDEEKMEFVYKYWKETGMDKLLC